MHWRIKNILKQIMQKQAAESALIDLSSLLLTCLKMHSFAIGKNKTIITLKFCDQLNETLNYCINVRPWLIFLQTYPYLLFRAFFPPAM